MGGLNSYYQWEMPASALMGLCMSFSLGSQSSTGRHEPRVRDQDWMMAGGAALLGSGTAEGTGQRGGVGGGAGRRPPQG